MMKTAAIGELLYDRFPDFDRLGGAPGNVAAMLAQFGANSALITAVGDDAPGRQAVREIAGRGVNTDFIQRNSRPTGEVLISLDDAGKPAYRFAADSAWDHLEFSPELRNFAATLDAVCFGSLGQRGNSAAAIRAFIAATRPGCLRVFDVNLRAPYYTPETVLASLAMANILKLNDEELPILARICSLPPEKLIAALLADNIELVALTRGAEGADIRSCTEFHHQPAAPLERRADTVGAGDAFTAALIAGLLQKRPIAAISRHATLVAAYVCSQHGATPQLPGELAVISTPRPASELSGKIR